MDNNFIEQERKILKFWEEGKIFEKLRKKNKGKKRWSFLDGPITANNPMGVHHAWGRTYKDVFQRYKAMQGFDQRFQNGFDCQGLWVEVEVEKELGFKSKKDIEQYGIEKFVEKCKERVMKYSGIQTEQSIRLGQWMDWEHSYYTMSDENNYAIWHFLKECHEKGLLYKGRDSVPWCPRCGTAISQHEILTEEYKEITHKAIYFKLPIVGQKDTYFLVWTTTPWTLPGNVALAVHSDFDYVKVKDRKGDVYILLKEKVGFIEGGEVTGQFKGKELEGMEYEGFFDDLPAVATALQAELPTVCKELSSFPAGAGRSLAPSAHKVILWDEVTQEEGTGIVHIAPGCGQEDFQLAKNEEFPVIDLTDNESNYRQGFGELSGKFVGSQEVREWIFQNLENKGLVFKIEDYTHRYPTCWRCKSELIFRVVDEWYISMEKLRKPLMESAKKINWIPDFCLERELDWLKNMQDWLISKKRYWGLALPIWECECGNFEVVGSKEELKEKVIEGWQEFDPPAGAHSPHRPWLDAIKLKCSKCGKLVSRIKDVGTPWLDAGIVPFSTVSDDNRSDNIPYFHNNKKEWKKWFPVEFVCESFPGQFKNWFYVLLVMSQVLEKKPPFKTLFGYALVVDEKGEEMHKSKGNAIWFNEAVEKIGADVMRWMYIKQNPANNMRFGYNVAKETHQKLLTLWNCFVFFETYGSKNTKGNIEISKYRNILDKWILSKLNGLIKTATESLDKFDPAKASQAIEDFFINDLSLWYIRRSRKRFQTEEKETASDVLYFVLLTLTKLIAPTMPFLAEHLYQHLGEGQPFPQMGKGCPSPTLQGAESVHLCDWPKSDERAISECLEKKMDKVREIVSKALSKRTELGLKVRQPLLKLKIKNQKSKTQIKNQKLLELIGEEVNVREVVFDDKIKEEIELDSEVTSELKEEGQVREIIRQIQDLRKKAGMVPQDKAIVYFATASEELKQVLAKNKAQILETTKSQVLQEVPQKDKPFSKEVKINGHSLWLAIGK